MTKQSDFENKILFMQQVIAPDDIYLFATSLIEISSYLCFLINELNNIESVDKNHPEYKIILNQILKYLHKYETGDLSPIKIIDFSEDH